MEKIIVFDAKPTLSILFNCVPTLTHDDEEIEDFLCTIWESIQESDLMMSQLMDQARRYQDMRHPFAKAVMPVGFAMRAQLESLGYFSDTSPRDFYYARRHGKFSFIVMSFQRIMQGAPDAPF